VRDCLVMIPLTLGSCVFRFFVRGEQCESSEEAKNDSIEIERKAVATGMAYAMVCAILCILIPTYVFTSEEQLGSIAKSLDLHSMSGRVAYAMRWQSIEILPLLLGVGSMATSRFFGDLSTIRGNSNPKIGIQSRFLQNTLEQFALAVPTQLGLAISGDTHDVCRIPILVIAFVCGRILFWFGYVAPCLFSGLDNSAAGRRAFGFALTFYPTVLAIIMNIGRFVSSELIKIN